jgi:hypothetical protein
MHHTQQTLQLQTKTIPKQRRLHRIERQKQHDTQNNASNLPRHRPSSCFQTIHYTSKCPRVSKKCPKSRKGDRQTHNHISSKDSPMQLWYSTVLNPNEQKRHSFYRDFFFAKGFLYCCTHYCTILCTVDGRSKYSKCSTGDQKHTQHCTVSQACNLL